MLAYLNGKIFTGEQVMLDKCVLTSEGKVLNIVPATDVPEAARQIDLQGNLLAPAFTDLQIYGGNGQLFGEFPSVDALASTYEFCRSGGATHFLPTVATNSEAVMSAAIQAVREYWAGGGRGVLGLHLEGPYIHSEKRGAHLSEYIQKPDLDALKKLVANGHGVVKMMTIAPEVFDGATLDYLLDQGIRLSAGHSNATYDQAMWAFDKGIDTATHLYNAMSALQHRAPGMVGAIFEHPGVSVSVVADGYHVDFAAIRIAKKILQDRMFLITDAVTENPNGRYAHLLAGEKYIVPDGTLSGSALTMLKAVKNSVRELGGTLEESLRMASLYPARVMGLEHRIGRIAPGFDENFIVLDPELQLINVFDRANPGQG